MKQVFWALACLLLLFSSCKEKESQEVIDERIIQEYIAANSLNAVATGSGLHYVILDSGLTGRPNLASTVKVYYTGRLTDGTVFDEVQSPSNPATFPLANLIEGWREGIPLIGKEGKEILLVPSALGYGSRATGSIPANSVLIFNIELVDHI